MEPLFFKPIPFETIWGGTAIKDYYGYDWMPDKTGQAWAFADQPKGSNVCMTAPFEGKTLGELWKSEPQLFGDTDRDFPLIISMLCPCDDLSIQVHPDMEHAKAMGYASGKNEAWYFLEAADDASIVFGHNAENEADLRSYIDECRWDELLRHLKVRKDDFVYLEAGLLHACGKNVIAYEVQQSTDVTYRFYDYDRADAAGNKRELQLEQAIGTLKYDGSLNTERYDAHVEMLGNCVRTTYMDSPSFRIEKIQIDDDSYVLKEDIYELVSVVRGSGDVNGTPVAVGSHFLVPKDCPVVISGNLTVMMTTA